VVLISHEYPPYIIGGIGSYCYNLAKVLSEKRIQTIVFCGVSKRINVSQVNKYLKVVRLPSFDVPPRYLWFQLRNFRTISKAIKDNCILHAVNPNSFALFRYLKKKLRVPIVTTIHEHPLAAIKVFSRISLSEWSFGDFRIYAASYPLDAFFMQACLRSSDHIIVPGKFTKDYLIKIDRKISQDKISVVYNGVALEEIDKIPSSSKNDANLRIINYGRLVSTKGTLYLLEIMPKICNKFSNVELVIVGKGPLESKIISKISYLNIKNKVHLRGFLPHSQLIREIKDSDVIVLPTFHEVGPFISALEAMACKKTLVVFDLCFSREFITNMRNGLMAKPLDTSDLYDKVSMALSDSSLRKQLGRNAYDWVKKHHNWRTLSSKYIEIYEKNLHR